MNSKIIRLNPCLIDQYSFSESKCAIDTGIQPATSIDSTTIIIIEIVTLFGHLQATVSSNSTTQCLRDLRLTDPRHDKLRIEQTKGGLFHGSYCWILENAGFYNGVTLSTADCYG